MPKLQELRYVTVKYTDDRCDKWNRFVRTINTDSINSCEKYMYYATRPTISWSVFKLYCSIYKCQYLNRCFIPRQEAQVFARLAYNHRFVFKPNMREWDLKIQPIIISPSSNQDAVSFTPRIKDQLHIGYRLPHPSGSWCCNLPLINPTLYLICKG